jgi:hypothetical protein
MNYFGLLKNKYTLSLNKFSLELLLLILPTSNKFIIALSQNLDKHIVAYQKELFFNKNVNDDSVETTNSNKSIY